MGDFIGKVLDLIYPIRCVICNSKTVKREEHICNLCKNNLKTDVQIIYLRYLDMENKTVKCVSSFLYNDNYIKNSILRFKFQGYKFYSEFFAKIMAENILDKFKNVNFDYVCFVPLRKERQKNRGYNQAECLALDVSKFTEIPFKDILVKIKNNHVQHELDLEDRIENVKGVYDIRTNSDIKNKTILLCDDIVTSTSTLSECAKILLKNGAKSVYCCTIAHSSLNKAF